MPRWRLIGVMILCCWFGGQRVSSAAEPVLTVAEQQRLAQLTKDLTSADPETLDQALQGLSVLGPKAISLLEPLTRMLADDRVLTYATVRYRSLKRTFQVNVSVVTVLRDLGPQATPSLVLALQNKDEKVRLKACEALVQNEATVARDVWVQALQDRNLYVQSYAARELGKSKQTAAVDALCQALQDEDPEVRIEVAQSLGNIGAEQAIGPLIAALPKGTTNVNVESALGRALAKIGAPAVRVLMKQVDQFDESGQRMANLAIREVDAQQHQTLLHECLIHKNARVREAAVAALASLKTPDALRVVREATKDPDWNVRWTAAHWLGKLSQGAAAEQTRPMLLRMAQQDPHERVRNAALWALYHAAGLPTEDYWQTLSIALQDSTPSVRSTAACSCSKFPHARFGPRLRELLHDADVSVRAEAAAALGHCQIRDAVPDLIRILEDTDERCLSYAAYSLARLSTDEALAALETKVRDATVNLKRRGYALQALCLSPDPRATPTLRAALADPALLSEHERVREALQKLGQK